MSSAASDPTGVAIIGMACRLPGADSPAAFWDNLCRSVESIRFFSDAELLGAGVDPALLARPNYVRAAPTLGDVEQFDASFFGYSPREVELLEPQQRLFLEVAWEAFEDAGYHAESCPGVVGVFAGGGSVVTSYLISHASHPDLPGQTASVSHLGNDKDFLSTRVSYKLNLTGPSITVQTACSTSLVAVHLACQSILAGESDLVLAGGATVRIPQVNGYVAEKGNVHSLDGHCRPFDAGGQGTIFGSGVAAVLLKPVARALADGDHVYAVIKGSAVNNDGGRKVSYTAPSVTGQARAMVEAITMADVSPDTIGYVECHATGTAAGDPLEIEALTRAFRCWTQRTGFCAVGSAKGNIGHPEQTAGLASLIKAALAVHHGQWPPTLNFTTPNPAIDFASSPFHVNSALRAWPASDRPRRAAVNSLGIGGTNAFVVLEQAPDPAPSPAPPGQRAGMLLTLSTKSESALWAYLARVAGVLEATADCDVPDLCYTSNVSRSQLPVRFAASASTTGELRDQLASASTSVTLGTRRERRPVAFLFTGQGSQYAGMGAALYQAHPIFREALDRCAAIVAPRLERSLLDVIFATEGTSLLDETRYTQPALFAVEYALAQLWLEWGITPDAVMGHSVGELVAACVAGTVSLEDALPLVAERGRLMQGLARGAMAVVMAPEDAVQASLTTLKAPVSIAAVNSPETTVVSGDPAAVRRLTAALQARGIRSTPLPVSHAFHSPLVEPMLARFETMAKTIAWRAARIPLVANVTGERMDGGPDARYWRRHARLPVRFADGLRTLHGMGIRVFLEIGPGSALLAAGRVTLPDSDVTWLPCLGRQRAEWRTLLDAVRQLYLDGASIDWTKVHRGDRRRRRSLPTYPFQRKRYWLGTPVTPPAPPRSHPAHPLLAARLSTASAEVSFDSALLTPDVGTLRDHRVGGAVVLPLAAALDAAMVAAAEALGTSAVVVRDVVYQEAIVLTPGRPRTVRTTVAVTGHDDAPFRIGATEDGVGARTHVTGVVSRSATKPDQRRRPRPSSGRRQMAGARYYAALGRIGLDYGAAFRGIRRLWHGRGDALGEIALPAGVSPTGYRLHPNFLDACLHLYPAAIGAIGRRPRRGTLFLPTGVRRFVLHRDGITEGWAHAVRRDDGSDDRARLVDIRVYDADGNPVALIEGLSLHRLPTGGFAGAASPDDGLLYELRWQPRSLATQAEAMARGRWLLFADRGGMGDALARRLGELGQECCIVSGGKRLAKLTGDRWSIDPGRPEDVRHLVSAITRERRLLGVVYLGGLDAPAASDLTLARLERAELAGCGGAVFLYQALVAARSGGRFAGRLWLVTRNSQDVGTAQSATGIAQAPLWGLGRTIALEAPALWGGLVDLPPTRREDRQRDAAALAAELLGSDGEDQVALREGRRFVARLGRLTLAPLPRRRGAGHRGTYLVTGGLGMLGQQVARWLVEELGIRSLVLAGRRATGDAAQAAVRTLEALGARVRVVAADVAIEADVRRLLRSMHGLPPLRGVVHCAGVLEDGILEQMRWRQFTTATAPKIKGAWLLHRYTEHLPLELFVVQSSLLSLTGSAGQANYTAANAFLDALVALRRRAGLPALAVNWGPWGEAGMAAARGARGAALWKARGVRLLAPARGLPAFARLVTGRQAHAVVADIDWPAFVQQLARPAPLYADLARLGSRSVVETPPSADLGTRLSGATPETRRALIVSLVQERITRELGFDEPIDVRRPLNELGLDSLMSVNIANRLETALGIPVPLVRLIRGPSVAQLVDDLFPSLPSASDAGADRPTPPAAIGDTRRSAATSTTSPDGWLVFPKPRPAARARLFCFPFAGAGATTFRPWAESLAPDIELVAVEPPGRAGRIAEKPVTSVKMFTEGLVPELLRYTDRPFAFFGHCLGGVTAFESARRLLEEHRLGPRHLFVSAARPPHLLDREGRFEHRLLASLLALDAFDPLVPIHELPDDVFAEVIRQFNIGATDEFLSRPELRQVLLPAVRADFAMASGYRAEPETLPGLPITAFAGLDDPYVTREDAVGWSEYTRTTFRLHLREGAHFLVVDDKTFMLDTISHELVR